MLAASPQRRVLSHSEPNPTRSRFCQRRTRRGASRKAGGDDRCFRLGREGDRAFARRVAVDPGRGPVSPARHGSERAKGAHDRGADCVVRRACQGPSRLGAVGGCALDRSHLARCVQSTCRSAAGAARALGDHLPAGIRGALDRPRPCRTAVAEPLRAAASRRDDRSPHRRQGPAVRGARADRRQDGRRAAVRGGADQNRHGVGPVAGRGRRLCPQLGADPAVDSLDPARTR